MIGFVRMAVRVPERPPAGNVTESKEWMDGQ